MMKKKEPIFISVCIYTYKQINVKKKIKIKTKKVDKWAAPTKKQPVL